MAQWRSLIVLISRAPAPLRPLISVALPSPHVTSSRYIHPRLEPSVVESLRVPRGPLSSHPVSACTQPLTPSVSSVPIMASTPLLNVRAQLARNWTPTEGVAIAAAVVEGDQHKDEFSGVALTSVKRKRIKKMAKHKLKKRRRRMKALMRRQGKI